MDDDSVDITVVLGKNGKASGADQSADLIFSLSFRALSKEANTGLAGGFTLAGSIANSGQGGMLDEERELASAVH